MTCRPRQLPLGFAVAALLLLLSACATAPPRTPAADSSTAPELPTRPETSPTIDPPPSTPPRNPMLVDASAQTDVRGERLSVLSNEAFALRPGEDGYYLDVLFAQLRKTLGTRAELERDASAIRVILPPTISFEVASARLSPDAVAELDSILTPLSDYAALLISVHGHTDATGPAEVNQRLSAQRALTVATRLQALGNSSSRIMAIGHGPSMPRASNDSVEGRQQNRRVELLLEPIVAKR